MKKVVELRGAELDFWVAKAQGCDPEMQDGECWLIKRREISTAMPSWPVSTTADWNRTCITGIQYRPSQDWFDGGPIIDTKVMSLCLENAEEDELRWSAYVDSNPYLISGRTALEAAMRAFVFSVFGEEV